LRREALGWWVAGTEKEARPGGHLLNWDRSVSVFLTMLDSIVERFWKSCIKSIMRIKMILSWRR